MCSEAQRQANRRYRLKCKADDLQKYKKQDAAAHKKRYHLKKNYKDIDNMASSFKLMYGY